MVESAVRRGGSDVSWAFIIAGLAGFALGSAFKPPALIVASLLLVLGMLPAVVYGSWSLLEAVGVLATLQGAYLGGLGVILLWRRTFKASTTASEVSPDRREP
jgi:hypothetical protein